VQGQDGQAFTLVQTVANQKGKEVGQGAFG